MPIIQMGRAFEGIENIVRGEDIVENKNPYHYINFINNSLPVTILSFATTNVKIL